MQCSNCGTENSPRVKFCAECGTPVGIPCPNCAFRNPPDAVLCGGCGQSLASAPNAVAERRQLTVFFADIVGSTGLAESLDPEDLHELYARYQAVCAEAIHRYEGHLAQYLGDGVLAYFGYPAAHEDDAARAVRAGLDILNHAGSINVAGNRPRVRIGIHTGLVVVGDVGAGVRREQLALGEAPNIAARLQSEAQPDTIVISNATRRLLSGQFELEDLGSRTLKGLSRPMQIFRVRGTSGAASRFEAMKTAHGLTPFVGREREGETIRAAWTEAVGGRGRTLLLRGEAGMGKSRLLEAAQQIAAGLLHEVFAAECSPYQMNNPLHPIVEMLERRMGWEKDMPPTDKLDLIEQFAAGRGAAQEKAASALAHLLSVPTLDRYPAIEMAPAKLRKWTIEVLSELLLHSVGGCPVLLLLEDLHWADPSTLDLLGEIVTKQTSLPVLVICTTRPEFSPAWIDQPNCREIRVESLSLDDTRALVAHVAGPKPLPLALREELVARTGGIPLFVEAVTRTVMDAGILRELDDRYELTGPLPPGLIPATVQDSLMGRIDRLGADRPVAQLAATIGRESSFELLQAVLGKPTEDLARALQHLVDLELVSESGKPPSSTYTFRHALIQDAAYESLLRKTRQEFHGRIAEVLGRRFPEMAETKPELLARHYEGAGRTGDATAGWMKAGLQAQQRFALRECAAYLQRTIAQLETLPGDDHVRLRSEIQAQLALAQALSVTLGWGSRELEAACIRARDIARRVGDDNALLQALMALSGGYLVRGTIGPALEARTPILKMALPTGNPVLQLTARHAASFATYFAGDFAQARDIAEQAIPLYDPRREREMFAKFNIPSSFACRHVASLSLWFMGYPDRAAQVARDAWPCIEVLAIPAATIFGFANTLMFHYLRRDLETVALEAERLYALSTAEGYPYYASIGRIYRGWAQAMSVHGNTEAGVAELKAGIENYRQTSAGLMIPQYELMMAETQMRAGRPDEAIAALSRGLRHACEYREHVHEPDLHRFMGEIHLAQGDRIAAEASFRRAIEVAEGQRAKMLELRAALALAKLELDRSRTAEVRALLQPLSDWFQEGADTPELLEARAVLASLGRSAGRG
jgi:class 3 adenylate cyclase/tetratricopeptide (TPR) repeat protein